jgi:hypothetical protein
MKSIKAYSLTAFALAIIVVVTGFVHPGGYSAQAAPKIVLCKKPEKKMCPNDETWRTGKGVRSILGSFTISGTLNLECSELKLAGPISPRMGTKLKWTIKTAVFEGCEEPCEAIAFNPLPIAEISAEDEAPWDIFWFLFPVTIEALCAGNQNCTFTSDPKVAISAPTSSGLPKIMIKEAPLTRTFGDPNFCGNNNTWTDNFIMEGGLLNILLALYELTSKEEEEQESNEKHDVELANEEWHKEELEIEKEWEQNPTSFCKEDPGTGPAETCPKGELITHVHETTLSGEKARLLSGPITVECDVLFLGETVAEAGDPLRVEGSFTYSNCGSCTVAEENGPAEIQVSKTGHESASVVSEVLSHVNCSGFVNCRYNGAGLEWTAKGPLLSIETNGEVALEEQVVNKESGFLCPSTAKLDITLAPLSALHITSW